jgi:hypothetical protein
MVHLVDPFYHKIKYICRQIEGTKPTKLTAPPSLFCSSSPVPLPPFFFVISYSGAWLEGDKHGRGEYPDADPLLEARKTAEKLLREKLARERAAQKKAKEEAEEAMRLQKEKEEQEQQEEQEEGSLSEDGEQHHREKRHHHHHGKSKSKKSMDKGKNQVLKEKGLRVHTHSSMTLSLNSAAEVGEKVNICAEVGWL